MITLHTNLGDIVIKTHADKAPITVENFITYCKDGFYTDTIFHRVIKGFMIQGGGFTADMVQKPTRCAIKNESSNGLKNVKGTLAMARTNDPNSATCQFFINLVDNSYLDYVSEKSPGYCVFAEVIEGMDVVDKIKDAKTSRHGMHQDVPVEAIVITGVTVG